MNRGESLLRHLGEDYTEPVRDPLWKHIYLSFPLSRITSSEPFLKLTRIKQLGPTHIVYPGATHTRAAHSLGVFQISKRIVTALASRGLLGFATLEGLKSFLAAALLHDLGHFPYAHSLKELPLREHEELTAELILGAEIAPMLREGGASPEMAAAIVDRGLAGPGGEELGFYRALLSGVLDPDKLDYLNRDAYFCGVPYGVQDIDFIIDRLALDAARRPAVDSRGIPAIESILFSKYLMYRNVYWHQSVRCATAMMKKAVAAALATGAVEPEGLYGLDDDSLFLLLSGAPGLPSSLSALVASRRLHPLLLKRPFEIEKAPHAALLDLGARGEAEAAMEAELGLGPGSVVIDIPEPVSFDSDMEILDEGKSFRESSTVFKGMFVDELVRSLRHLRVFCPAPPERALPLAQALLGDG